MKTDEKERLPLKMDYPDFLSSVNSAFNGLCKKYKFELSVSTDLPQKDFVLFNEVLPNYTHLQKIFNKTEHENIKFHKLKYTHKKNKRLIEIVTSSTTYGESVTFCNIESIYLKRLTESDLEPSYDDYTNCFDLFVLAELLYNMPFNRHINDTIKNMRDMLVSMNEIINGSYWPSLEDLKNKQLKNRGFISIGKPTGGSIINEVKEELAELQENGYDLIHDESLLPPYEVDNLIPGVGYFNKKKGEVIYIYYDYREQELFATANKQHLYKGSASKENYVVLKNKILSK